MNTRLRRLVGATALALAAFAGEAGAVTERELALLKLPPGFKIQLYARVPAARSMAVAPELDAVFVGTRTANLYAVFDRDRNFVADAVETVGSNFKIANGIAWKEGWLYLAEQHRLTRWQPRPGALGRGAHIRPAPEILYVDFPDKFHHGWRYVAVGPDSKLYVAVGAACNVCEATGLEGTIVRMNLNGSGFEIFARGVRNSLGIDFHPISGELWFTDNGADFMGDDTPPDELNRAPKAGLHFGFPFFAGGRVPSPNFADQAPPADVVLPELELSPHVAALGLHFYRGAMFPPEYRASAFIAQHGSFDRAVPDGYRIVRVVFDVKGNPQRVEPFLAGFLQRGQAFGTPVDVKELADGSLLVSDDRAGAIYRITYQAP